jgi:hypothetical protein
MSDIYKVLTFAEYKASIEANIYLPYSLQRNLDKKHIKDIKDYIEANYDKPHFDFNTILVCQTASNKFDIIDGMHRSYAVLSITNPHILNNTTLHIREKPYLNDDDRKTLFQHVNLNKPMQQIFIDDNYIETLYDKTLTLFKTTYGEKCIGKLYPNIPLASIRAFCSRENVLKFIKNEQYQYTDDSTTLFNILHNTNKKLTNLIQILVSEDTNLDVEVFSVRWDHRINATTEIKKTKQLVSAIYGKSINKAAIRDAIDEIRKRRKKIVDRQITYYEPFCLGMSDLTIVQLIDTIDTLYLQFDIEMSNSEEI